MSRKEKRERQIEVIKAAVARVRQVIQDSYNADQDTDMAITAGAKEMTVIMQKNPGFESTILYFCKLEQDRLAEVMQATDMRIMPKTLKQKWLEMRAAKRVAEAV